MSEPNSKFQKVSSCCGASMRLCIDVMSQNRHIECTKCNQTCDAVSDEGLEDDGCKCHCKLPFCEKLHNFRHILITCEHCWPTPKVNSEIPKKANSSEKPNCFACQDEKDNNSTVENYYHYCAKKDNLPSPDAKEEKNLRLKVKDLFLEKSKRTTGYTQLIAVADNGDEYIISGDYCGGIPVSSWRKINQ